MTEPLSYHVYTNRDGGLWLADDEKLWTSYFHHSAAFTSHQLAHDIGEREKLSPEEVLYILACMPSL